MRTRAGLKLRYFEIDPRAPVLLFCCSCFPISLMPFSKSRAAKDLSSTQSPQLDLANLLSYLSTTAIFIMTSYLSR
jgi:hypothetical protein